MLQNRVWLVAVLIAGLADAFVQSWPSVSTTSPPERVAEALGYVEFLKEIR